MLDRKTTFALLALAACLLSSRPVAAADLTIDRATTYQTIEGFGFFGAADVWWSSASAVLDQAWTAKVIDDLGITMWRNEYYAEGTPQDATWEKQKPVVQALVNYANQKGVKLKILLTAWSPPASLKCLSDDDSTCNSNPPTRPADTKGGNTLDPAKRSDLAAWLVAGAQMYHDAGADLYAVSFQNEPLFSEPYNSCVYSQSHYAATLAAIGPSLKAAFPDLKLFGSENMLGTECGKSPGTVFDPYWYTANIMNNAGALAAIDAFAVHGYVDGVSATATSKLAAMWTSFRTGTAKAGKAIWMTETSGYTHTWPGTSSAPGPLDLAQAIYASLAYGNLSAWTYWQGSEKDGYTEYSLMAGAASLGKNYYVSKQFFRFIRPGAERVDVQSSDPEVMVVAFQHPTMNAFTIVAINVGSASKTINLAGAGLPADFHAFRTSASENSADLGTVAADGITLPASSITTFVNGSYIETPGGGGTGGNGGSSGTGGTTAAGGSTGQTGAGGRTGTGGAIGTGGRTGAGGTPASGGAVATGGGMGTGGVAATGGRPATGGTTGTTAPGGTIGTGGATSGVGGVVGAGGTPSTTVGSGGKPGSGGVTSGAGGITSTTSSGGTITSTGGAIGAGGAMGVGGNGVVPVGKGGAGCSCRVGGPAGSASAFWAFLLAGIGMVAARGRRRSRRRPKGEPEAAKLAPAPAREPSLAATRRWVPEHDQDFFPYAILRDLVAMPMFRDDLSDLAVRLGQADGESKPEHCEIPAKDARR